MLKFVKQYPAAISGLVEAALAAFVAFGVHLSADQSAAILGVTGALLACFVHTQVTPNTNVPAVQPPAPAPLDVVVPPPAPPT